MFTVIPAIDLLNGEVVRLTQGDYAQVSHYDYTPAALAKHFEDHGATRIHIVDLDGAKDGYLVNKEAILAIRGAVSCELELGGGIRDLDSAIALFELGLNFLVLGSLLTKDFSTATQIINYFPGKIIAGIDLKDGGIAVEGWLETSKESLPDLLSRLSKLPIESIISTEVSRDGMMQGPDIESLTTLSQNTKIPLIASGGVRSLEDIDTLRALASSGIMGCIVGKAILSEAIDIKRIWR
jgi:phosphoribosylformimino-5-aminoimidazole carboxamide ribotide isomerase